MANKTLAVAPSEVRTLKTEVMRALTANYSDYRQSLMARSEYMWRLMDDPRKDINAECGYPYIPTVFMYRQWYDREGIATRVVNVYPDECWSVHPELYEDESTNTTPFEAAWQQLLDTPGLNPWHYLHRADGLSGIGAFGVLLLGIDDGGDLSDPVPGIDMKTGEKLPNYKKEHKLLYMRTFDQTLVMIHSYETDPHCPRYGQPNYYTIKFTDPLLLAASVQPSLQDYTSKLVHWTRLVHLADNRMSSEVFGVPRMQSVLNRLFDLRKILGGSGEMFWRGSMPGWAFETPPELGTDVEMDDASIKDQMEAMQNGLQRYIAVTGMKVRSMAPQVSPPTHHVEEQLRAVCTSLAVPLRIFQGSESGHLASQQDAETWNRRLKRRQQDYLNPCVIAPFVQRLVACGVLPKPKKFFVNWNDLAAVSDEQKADISLKKSQALFQYVSGKCETALPLREFFILVMGMTPMAADFLISDIKKNGKLFTEKAWDKPEAAVKGPSGGAKKGSANKAKNGRPRNVKTKK